MGNPLAGPVQIMRCHKSGDVPAALLPGQICVNEYDGILFFPDASTTANGSGQYTTVISIGLKALIAALSAVRSLATGGTGQSASSSADLLAKLGAAALAGAAFTGGVTVPNVAASDNSSNAANTAFVQAAISALVASAPGALNTLKELADALGDDPNFATTVANAIAAKAPLASPALTGNPTAPTQAAGDGSSRLATTAYADRASAGALTRGQVVAAAYGDPLNSF